MTARRLVLSTLALLPLAACGRKGPMTLPPKEPQPAQAQPAVPTPDAGTPNATTPAAGMPPKPPAN